MNEQTNIQMDERKDENYIPLDINDGAITILILGRLGICYGCGKSGHWKFECLNVMDERDTQKQSAKILHGMISLCVHPDKKKELQEMASLKNKCAAEVKKQKRELEVKKKYITAFHRASKVKLFIFG